MNLQFPIAQLTEYSSRYSAYTDMPADIIAPKVRERGYLTYPEFLEICAWKTPRSKPLCRLNSPSLVEEATRIALSCEDEKLRIETLLILKGVNYPTASTILHFCHSDKYPIIDFRALWSLGYEKVPSYTFEFWLEYFKYCRMLSEKTALSMREVDKGLWQYSKEHQK